MLTIKAEAMAGDNIEDTFKSAIALSKNIGGVLVEFSFNGVTCMAYSNGNIEKGVKEYHRALSSGGKYKFASS